MTSLGIPKKCLNKNIQFNIHVQQSAKLPWLCGPSQALQEDPWECPSLHEQPKLKGQLLQGDQELNPPVGLLHLQHNTIISQPLVMSGTPDTGWPSKHIHTKH